MQLIIRCTFSSLLVIASANITDAHAVLNRTDISRIKTETIKNRDVICNASDSNNKCDVFDHNITSTSLLTSNSLKLDLRPNTCTSYFEDVSVLRRGKRIENAAKQSKRYNGFTSTNEHFPVIDFFTSNSVIVLISKDLSANEYQTPGMLFNTVIEESKQIRSVISGRIHHNLSGEESSDDNQMRPQGRAVKIYYDLIIQSGIGSKHQASELEDAIRQSRLKYDIEINVVEIP